MRKEIERIIWKVDISCGHKEATDQICSLFIEMLEKERKKHKATSCYAYTLFDNLIKEVKGE